jgi:MoxR-like ATPase
MNSDAETLGRTLSSARAEVAKVVIGQDAAVDLALASILAGQHALVEGVPGIAKTLLVRTLARVLGCEFARIQFTPDLMPADITGTNVWNQGTGAFTLMPGPIFTTFLLADEINRAPAKTQSALLQAMQERQVTIDRTTHSLSSSFTVFATQNPIEYEGTYPLPEAQKDRFMVKIPMGPPSREEELTLARRTLGEDAPEAALVRGDVAPVLEPGALARIKPLVKSVVVRDEIVAYATDLVRATRTNASVLVGAGPRATQALLLASRAFACLAGRDFVTPDDVKRTAGAVLAHRLVLRPEYEIEGLGVGEVLDGILKSAAVPR